MNGETRTPSVVTEDVLAVGRAAGLAAVGVAPAEVLEPARSIIHLRKAAGLAGDMQFTYRNPDRSTDPETALPGARSIIAGAWGYGHWQPGTNDQTITGPSEPGVPSAAIARYSWHDHYADLEDALQRMADQLVAGGYRARVIADTNALVDRNVAWRAGLGWYGKNSNLLIPGLGSWFVLGSVITDAELTPTGPPIADGCGPCNRCIEDCPTGAIVAPGVVDATRCLAWIVQAPGPIPAEFRTAVGDRIYGCDDCQDVCPPNRSPGGSDDRGSVTRDDSRPGADRGPGSDTEPEGNNHRPGNPSSADDRAVPVAFVASPERVRADVRWLLSADDDEILARHGRWYIPARNVDYIRRTALVVLGNVAAPDDRTVIPLLRRYLTADEPMLRLHATWAAKRLGLTRLLVEDEDPVVRIEQQRSVEPRFSSGEWSDYDGESGQGTDSAPVDR